MEKEEWRRGFLESGGMEYIVDVLLKHSFFENKMKGDKSKVCLSLLLKILNNFVIGNIHSLYVYILIYFYSER